MEQVEWIVLMTSSGAEPRRRERANVWDCPERFLQTIRTRERRKGSTTAVVLAAIGSLPVSESEAIFSTNKTSAVTAISAPMTRSCEDWVADFFILGSFLPFFFFSFHHDHTDTDPTRDEAKTKRKSKGKAKTFSNTKERSQNNTIATNNNKKKSDKKEGGARRHRRERSK